MSYPKICQLTPEEYQDAIIDISKHYSIFGTDKALPTYSLGLCEEVGEVAGLLKRIFRGDRIADDDFKQALTKELGDVTAYLVLVAHTQGIDFEDILLTNLKKLQTRVEKNTHIGTGSDR